MMSDAGGVDADGVPEIARHLREQVSHAVGLPSFDKESIGMLIDAGEWEVALEVLCTQMYEYDLEPTAEDRRQLEAIGDRLAVRVASFLGDAL